jgi:hypothetical protein
MSISENIKSIRTAIPEDVTLIAVSKTKPAEMIKEAYEAGQRDFGENRVQEMMDKAPLLPKDIRWHLIGHLQTNKVRYIAPFVHLIHSVDSMRLLEEIDKQGKKHGRRIDCLMQFHIAQEETKFGLTEEEGRSILTSPLFKEFNNIRIRGVMGMASLTEDTLQIHTEFRALKAIFEAIRSDAFENEPSFDTISMGMSGDYLIAIAEGSNMIRVGSSIFGVR